MKGDFSRFTFRKDKHYSGVRMQQGRVALDADWNEQTDIHAHLRHTLGRDVIGATGVPRERGGFLVAPGGGNFTLADGRIYVDGRLVENDAPVWFKPQDGAPVQPHYPLDAAWTPPDGPGLYIVYLDVWERHVTALEDPAIREVALGGPDTATRTQVIWQARLLRVGDTSSTLTCWDTPVQWSALLASPTARLSAQAAVAETTADPCVVPASAGYRGLENQLYRVEIHDGGTVATATFKWSRDNGMVVTRLLEVDGKFLTVADPGRDEVLGFAVGQWVEVSDEPRLLRGEPGVLARIKSVVENSVEVEQWPGAAPDTPPDLDLASASVRRWDHSGNAAALDVALNTWIDLEDGVQVRFDGDGDGVTRFTSGDYWLIPARTVSADQLGGDVEWPRVPDPADSEKQLPASLPPHGIAHRYAPLALVIWDGTNYTLKHDCRPLFPALTEPDLYYVSGDGQEAMPGERLPQPLRVGVVNCNRPIEGAWVKFEIVAGNGTLELDAEPTDYQLLSGTSSAITAFLGRTDADGEILTYWRLEELDDLDNAPDQLVRATLLREGVDVAANYLDVPVLFGATFGVAWQNQYGGSDFPDAQHPSLEVITVEEALDQLRENTALHYVSGDGQEAMPGDPLPQLLQVRVANGQWPRAGAQVSFTTQHGTLESGASSGQSISVTTDTNGLATCAWTPDAAGPASQQAQATLVAPSQFAGGDDPSVPGLVVFNANLSIAEEIAYAPPEDEIYSESPPTNVKEALDELYHAKVNRAGDTMTGDLIINANLSVNGGEGHAVVAIDGGLHVGGASDPGDDNLVVDGDCIIQGNLTVNGTTTTVNTDTLEVEDNIIRVNRYRPQPIPRPGVSGLEVFRGGTAPNAQIVWDEATQRWNIGVETNLYGVAYGPDWITLTTGQIADGLHRHHQLFAGAAAATPAVNVDAGGQVGINLGTAAPAAALHVNGAIRVEAGEGLVILGDNNYFGPNRDARVLRMLDTRANDGIVDGGIAIEGYTPSDNVRRPVVAIRGSGHVGIGTINPDARLHVVTPNPDLANFDWTEPVQAVATHPGGNEAVELILAIKLAAEDTFAPLRNVNRVTIRNHGGAGQAKIGGSGNQAYIGLQLQDADSGAWRAVMYWPLAVTGSGAGTTMLFDQVTVEFSKRDISGMRFTAALFPATSITMSGWNGMRFEFRSDHDAAIFEGRVGIGTATPAHPLDVQGNVNVSGRILQENWQTPSLLNAWVNYASGYNPAGYFLDKSGIVHLRGLVRSGTVGAAIFTLPAGYRPPFRELHMVMSNGAVARCDVLVDGSVTAVTGSNAWFSLDGITFRVA
jgi:hypothetical protein